jgi:hypothetical protein
MDATSGAENDNTSEKIHYSSIVWLGHVYTINAIYHQITKGKDENSVKYHASPTVRTISNALNWAFRLVAH